MLSRKHNSFWRKTSLLVKFSAHANSSSGFQLKYSDEQGLSVIHILVGDLCTRRYLSTLEDSVSMNVEVMIIFNVYTCMFWRCEGARNNVFE